MTPTPEIRERDIDRAMTALGYHDRRSAEVWLDSVIYADAARHRRWNWSYMPVETPAQRVYKALTELQLRFQEADDDPAHDLLCDEVLDNFHRLYSSELS